MASWRRAATAASWALSDARARLCSLSFRPGSTRRLRGPLSALPRTVRGWQATHEGLQPVSVNVLDEHGHIWHAKRYHAFRSSSTRATARRRTVTRPCLRWMRAPLINLAHYPLAGFVAEGGTPYGQVGSDVDRALRRAALQGMPVVKVSRGNADGFVPAELTPLAIAGGNLTATKARLLLMAALLKLGALPAAKDAEHPTARRASGDRGQAGRIPAHLRHPLIVAWRDRGRRRYTIRNAVSHCP